MTVKTGPAAKASMGQRAYCASVYIVLFALGAVQGLVGSFQYGRSPAPLIAIILDVLILATCVFGEWGTTAYGGALAPAFGWLVTSFYLSTGTTEGSVIIANTSAGQWYLFGGTLSVLLGSLVAFVNWRSRRATIGPHH
jgi:hypothetical protein